MAIKKIAQDPRKLMSAYVGFLRVLYLVHQNNHWEVSGSNAYGNHLLFERVYDGVEELLDEAAEKCIGVYGGLDSLNIDSIIDKFKVKDSSDPNAYVKSSLAAEKAFQALAEKTYQALKDSSTLTLGVDDMIMSQYSKSEVHTYLLQQALKEE